MKTEEFTVLSEKLDRVVEYMEKRFNGLEKRFDENDAVHDRLL